MTRLASGKTSEHSRPGDAQAWLSALRRTAAEQFAATGYPTTNEEEWRQTNIAPIAKTKFAAGSAHVTDETADLVRQSSFGEDAAAELVFVNGHFALSLSRMPKIGGLGIGTIEHCPPALVHVLERNLGQVAQISANPFVAMNTASLRDGAVLHLAKGTVIDQPVHLLYISTAGGEPTQSFPRLLIVAEENSHATLVESFVGGAGVHLTSAVT